MSVRLKWGHVAQLMEQSGPGFSLTRIFDGFGIQAGQPAVALPMPCYLAMMFEADAGDGPVHFLQATLLDQNDRPHCNPLEAVLMFKEIGPKHLLAPVMLEIGGWILPGVGDYRFQLRVNDRDVGVVKIWVKTIQDLPEALVESAMRAS